MVKDCHGSIEPRNDVGDAFLKPAKVSNSAPLSILSCSDGFQREFFVEEVEAVGAAVVDFFVVEGDVAATEADHCGVG